jgi:predicted O-methyltransferase YrrM
MQQEQWSAVDEYVAGLLAPHDSALEAASSAAEAAGLPAILGRALADGGRLVTLEVDPGYAKVALENIARAELDGVVDLHVGPALDLLPGLHAEGAGPFDFTFIDADKENTPAYFAWALDHSRPGSLIVADNVVRGGTLADSESDDPKAPAQRRLHEMAAAEDRVSATTIQTVGSKGYDGFTVALVKQGDSS